jgi:hypothetical protein
MRIHEDEHKPLATKRRKYVWVLIIVILMLIYPCLTFSWLFLNLPGDWVYGIVEVRPQIVDGTDSSLLKDYIAEFSHKLPPRMSSPTILFGKQGQIVAYESRNPWNDPDYLRYLRCYITPSLRPEHSIYLYDLSTKQNRFLFAGEGVMASPDKKKIVFLRSRGFDGYHSIHIWNPSAETLDNILSLWEGDPGSGPSFFYTWSDDSRALCIRGDGCLKEKYDGRRYFKLIYVLDSNTLYSIG